MQDCSTADDLAIGTARAAAMAKVAVRKASFLLIFDSSLEWIFAVQEQTGMPHRRVCP
jgi:hypothetical protein